MPRIARIIIPGCPHHVIQRGNRNQRTFFCDSDRALYLKLLKGHGLKAGISILAYCLMDNHVHLIAVPRAEDSFAVGIGETHRRYTTIINTREDWRGYLWQGKFSSFPMDETHFYAAVRYAERNPVRAGIVALAEDYPWSSARVHIRGQRDPLLADIKQFMAVEDWASYLREPDEEAFLERIRRCECTGRPLGEDSFLARLEVITGRRLRPRDYSRTGVKKEGQSIVSP